jgi:hypothetical protein
MVDSPAVVSEAIVLWTGWGRAPWPHWDESRLVDHFGRDKARELVPVVRRLAAEFYESDARLFAADLVTMGDEAAARFRSLHPDLTEESVEALAWCYTFDYK